LQVSLQGLQLYGFFSRFKLTTLVVIGTACIGSCKSNYHKITATTALILPARHNNIYMLNVFHTHLYPLAWVASCVLLQLSFYLWRNNKTVIWQLRVLPTCRKSLKLYYKMLCTSHWSRFKLTTLVVIGTDCIGSCKSYYHTITTDCPKKNDQHYIYLFIFIINKV
jgi:hypothetical protein